MADYRNAVDLANSKALGSGGLMEALQEAAQRRQQSGMQQAGFEQQGKLQQQQSDLEKAAQERELGQAQDIIDSQAKAGRSVNAKVGHVDISQKEDSPLKYLMRNQQVGAKAQQHAYDTYMKAFPDVQKRAQSAQEALEAINDPQQIGSVGQAKTLMIKNLGMNRYNQQEGNALVPQQFAQVIHGIYNAATGAAESPLTPTQRQALNSVFMGGLATAKKQHEMAKQNALGSYMHSGVADPAVAEQFKNTVGQDFDKQLNDIQEKYKKVPVTVGYSPSQSAQPQSQGPLDKLKSFFGMGQQSAAPAAPQGQAPMSFDEFKKRKAAGQL